MAFEFDALESRSRVDKPTQNGEKKKTFKNVAPWNIAPLP
jgi:hypothetical protein